MPKWLLRAASPWVLAIGLFTAPSAAQTAPSRPAGLTTALSTAVEDVLRVGRELERSGKWGEALSHYEDAVRHHPSVAELQTRHDVARIHFDLGRRYQDASFRRELTNLSQREALLILSEVLLKIETHYVHSPRWRDLIDHGTTTIETALAKPLFVETCLGKTRPEQVEGLRRELRDRLSRVDLRGRGDVIDAVTDAAAFAQARAGLSAVTTILEYTCGIASALDTYSTYLTPDQLRDVFAQIDGNFVGLGIEIKAASGGLAVVSVIAESPAAKAGIRAGDVIQSVDGHATASASTDQAANWLQGADGSVAALTVVTSNQPPRALRVRRANVDVPSIEDAQIVDPQGGVAYLKLSSFQKTTVRDLDTALWQLHRDGMRSLVMDLRGNPGGLLSSAVEIADRFIASGTIVSTRGRSPQEDFNYSAHKVGTWYVPLVVLVDGDSASASEIFAGAIQDNRRGTIVGRRSFGKGSVQGIFPLQQGGTEGLGGVRLTTAKFYAPSGRPISGSGVTPDVVVQKVAKPVVRGNNPATAVAATTTPSVTDDGDITAAVQVARRQLAQR